MNSGARDQLCKAYRSARQQGQPGYKNCCDTGHLSMHHACRASVLNTLAKKACSSALLRPCSVIRCSTCNSSKCYTRACNSSKCYTKKGMQQQVLHKATASVIQQQCDGRHACRACASFISAATSPGCPSLPLLLTENPSLRIAQATAVSSRLALI